MGIRKMLNDNSFKAIIIYHQSDYKNYFSNNVLALTALPIRLIKRQLLSHSLGCKSALIMTHDRPKLPKQNLPTPIISKGLLISKFPSQDRAMPEKNCRFQGTLSTSFENSLFSS